jgi:hypothetical protein
MSDPSFPFFVHSTKTAEDVVSIIRMGRIESGSDAPCAWRFNPHVDDLFGRSTSVMMNLGFGLFVDSAAMSAAFVFDWSLLRRQFVVVERLPVSFHTCRRVLEHLHRHERRRWARYFSHATESSLDEYNNRHLNTSFRDYMATFFADARPTYEIGDAWGASAYVDGIMTFLMSRSRLCGQLQDVVAECGRECIVPESEREAITIAMRGCRSAYRTPNAASPPSVSRCWTQLRVQAPVVMTSDLVVALYLKGTSEGSAAARWCIESQRERVRCTPRLKIFFDGARIA